MVDNPSENDHNFNQAERQHLRDLTLPLKEQRKRAKQNRAADRIIDPKVTPDGSGRVMVPPASDVDNPAPNSPGRPTPEQQDPPEVIDDDAPVDVEDIEQEQ